MTTRALIALLLSCSTVFAAPNLLTDPGFEGAQPCNCQPSLTDVWFAPFWPVEFDGRVNQEAILVSGPSTAGMLAQVWDQTPPDATTYLVGVHARLAADSDGFLVVYVEQVGGDQVELRAYPDGTVEHPPGTVIQTGVDFSTFQRLYVDFTTDGSGEIGVAYVKELGTTGAWVLDDAFVYEIP